METFLTILAVFLAFALSTAIAIGVVRLLGGPLPSREQAAEHAREFSKRLLSPQIAELERHYGHKLPVALCALYENTALLQRTDFYVVPPDSHDETDHHYIQRFEPADLQTLNESWFPAVSKRFPFAIDDFGNSYFVVPGDRPTDCPVYYWNHDGGDEYQIADSLATFLSWNTCTESERRT